MPADDDELGFNKRIAPRQQVFGEAMVIAPGVKARCIVRDLSATGARIGISQSIDLPNEFDLLLLKADSRRRVILRWRRGDFAGVEFRSTSKPTDAD